MSRRRVPYFERPPQPRDWRWFVGGTGRTLITLGLLLFGFVGYQLWGTGIATARAQADLERELEIALDQITVPPAPSTSAPDTTVATSAPPTTDAATPSPDDQFDDLPQAPLAPLVKSGTPLGKIVIPSIDVDWVFVQGVKYNDLKLGPGHFRETPMPGQLGNAAIAGHRTTYGQPFFDLDKLVEGDAIITETSLGRHVWQVTSSFVVSPSDYESVVPTTDWTKATLTLVTCTPAYTARQRLIVKAEILQDESDRIYAAPDELPPAEVFQRDGEITEDPLGVDDPADGTPTTDPSTGLPQPSGQAARSDAFSAGWFDDRAAIPHVGAWGTLTAALGLAAWMFGRRVRRLWVVGASGAVPVLLGLYFFYENLNRLLPPGL
ncbi:MAG: sortase [Ilumatobacteraceae bacterium]